MKLKLFLVIILGYSWIQIIGQDGINRKIDELSAAGYSSSNGAIVFDWIVGSLAVETCHHEQLFLTQGMLQPEVKVSSVRLYKPSLTLLVYPNPANEYITVEIHSLRHDQFNIRLYDIRGKLHENLEAGPGASRIDLSYLTAGIYIIKVLTAGNLIEEIKIAKL